MSAYKPQMLYVNNNNNNKYLFRTSQYNCLGAKTYIYNVHINTGNKYMQKNMMSICL